VPAFDSDPSVGRIANELSSQSGWIDRFRQWLRKNKMAVAQFVCAAKLPSKKSTAGVTSRLSRTGIADAGRSRFIFAPAHLENDVYAMASNLEFPITPA
jgi:hypothetical protein